ncbi:MAG: complex I NDUFA9 subunit family protein [Pseudohongiellaceae bacterium]
MQKPGLITVFGGTGFLGGGIVRCLNRQGIPVRVAVRNTDKRLEGLEHSDQVEYCEADVTDGTSVASAVEGAHGVINAVSLYMEKKGLTFRVIHVEGAHRVARVSRAAGVKRLIHISGLGVSKKSDSRFVRARARGEEVVRDAFPSATIFRPSVMFGWNDALLSNIDKVTRSPVVVLFGRGQTRLQAVYVDDVARAARAALLMPQSAARVFELGGPRIYTYRELVEIVMHYRGRRRLITPFPFLLWRLTARSMSILPKPPLTFDQVVLLQTDNVVGVSGPEGTLAELNVVPGSMEDRLPECLDGQEMTRQVHVSE